MPAIGVLIKRKVLNVYYSVNGIKSAFTDKLGGLLGQYGYSFQLNAIEESQAIQNLQRRGQRNLFKVSAAVEAISSIVSKEFERVIVLRLTQFLKAYSSMSVTVFGKVMFWPLYPLKAFWVMAVMPSEKIISA